MHNDLGTSEIYDRYMVRLSDGKEYLFYPNMRYDHPSARYVINKYIVKTITRCMNEDWKTAIAHKQPSIPENTELEVKDILQNFYGKFIEVDYLGFRYSLDPRNVKYIKTERKYI